MEFIQSANATHGQKQLITLLTDALQQDKKVLWLIGGGSNITISVAVMAAVPTEVSHKLSIFMIDERYGPINHIDSNAKQLLDAGFQTKEAAFVQVLIPGFALEETRERYSEASKLAFEHADLIVAQIGIGPDGHIAGILPHSAVIDSKEWVVAYETPTYTRISLGFEALKQIQTMYCFVFGTDRKTMLERLRDEELSLAEQPSQIIKVLPEAYIFNDQIGEKSS